MLKKGQIVYDKLDGKRLIIHEVIDNGDQYRCRFWDEKEYAYGFIHIYGQEINKTKTITQRLGFKK